MFDIKYVGETNAKGRDLSAIGSLAGNQFSITCNACC